MRSGSGQPCAASISEVEASDGQTRAILRDCLTSFSTLRLRVTGDCMQPALRPDDIVEIAPTCARRPRLGDIVLFEGPRGLRLHRLVPGPPRGWSLVRTKADRAAYWDPKVPRAALLGVVISAEPARDSGSLACRLRRVIVSLARTLKRPHLRGACGDDCHAARG